MNFNGFSFNSLPRNDLYHFHPVSSGKSGIKRILPDEAAICDQNILIEIDVEMCVCGDQQVRAGGCGEQDGEHGR